MSKISSLSSSVSKSMTELEIMDTSVKARCIWCKILAIVSLTGMTLVILLYVSFPSQSEDTNSPVWSEWTEYTPCSASCGDGRKTRTRTCVPPYAICLGPNMNTIFCREAECSARVDRPTINPIGNKTVQEGDDVSFTCTLSHGGDHFLTMPVFWVERSTDELLTMHDTLFSSDDRSSIRYDNDKSWTLTIRNVQWSDQGKYVCKMRPSPNNWLEAIAYLKAIH